MKKVTIYVAHPPPNFEFQTRLSEEIGDQCGPEGYQELAAIQSERSKRVVSNEKSTTKVIIKNPLSLVVDFS